MVYADSQKKIHSTLRFFARWAYTPEIWHRYSFQCLKSLFGKSISPFKYGYCGFQFFEFQRVTGSILPNPPWQPGDIPTKSRSHGVNGPPYCGAWLKILGRLHPVANDNGNQAWIRYTSYYYWKCWFFIPMLVSWGLFRDSKNFGIMRTI